MEKRNDPLLLYCEERVRLDAFCFNQKGGDLRREKKGWGGYLNKKQGIATVPKWENAGAYTYRVFFFFS